VTEAEAGIVAATVVETAVDAAATAETGTIAAVTEIAASVRRDPTDRARTVPRKTDPPKRIGRRAKSVRRSLSAR
jgi:hypothetical protein